MQRNTDSALANMMNIELNGRNSTHTLEGTRAKPVDRTKVFYVFFKWSN